MNWEIWVDGFEMGNGVVFGRLDGGLYGIYRMVVGVNNMDGDVLLIS